MLSPQDIADRINQRVGAGVLETVLDDKHPRVHIGPQTWRELAIFLRDDPGLSFDWLSCLGGVDYVARGQLAVVADLYSTVHRHQFAVKVLIDRADPRVPSIAHIWSAANWHEREAADLVGIEFTGHPDPRRILLADDWVGNPLRKDYVFPREVHGIPASVELDWQQKPDQKK
ncbi:MAG: NADH-quinone oxidoreductase subunit C [Burkholderiales bacterium]|nr:NADH-quinone oxidoreductase subunit C [Phycisphaerae bacterium]